MRNTTVWTKKSEKKDHQNYLGSEVELKTLGEKNGLGGHQQAG